MTEKPQILAFKICIFTLKKMVQIKLQYHTNFSSFNKNLRFGIVY